MNIFAALLPIPVQLIPIPITKPPKVSHSAGELKPEKMTSGGATENTIANRKNNREVSSGEIIFVAHKTMQQNARAATLVSATDHAGGGKIRKANTLIKANKAISGLK